MLHIHNTLTKKKELFVPIEPGKVRMYVCGMTVYDYCHLGHARVMVVFDTVARYLRSLGYAVIYVRNITDIDDKIIRRARENGEDIGTLTQRFIDAMNEDGGRLGVQRPDLEPRATDHIANILSMISTLVEKGFAYVIENGDVYYAVSRFENYGALSGKKLDDLRAGERVEVDEAKRDPLDFVLWKAAKPDEPSWPSPWGAGRPGWHIECSAMATHCLGEHFDIHGGGLDLQFPHHENEIAQSEAATGHTFVNVWMHNGFVRIDDEKMSKSLNNFFTVRDVLKHYHAEEIRYFILASQYRSPLSYCAENLDNARQALTRFYTALRGLPVLDEALAGQSASADASIYQQRFSAAMDDDFNSAEALGVLFDLVRELNKVRADAGIASAAESVRLATELRRLAGVLGLLAADPESYLQGATGVSSGVAVMEKEQIENYIAQRIQARNTRSWAESDRIRDLLKESGVLLEDSSSGTNWRRE